MGLCVGGLAWCGWVCVGLLYYSVSTIWWLLLVLVVCVFAVCGSVYGCFLRVLFDCYVNGVVLFDSLFVLL